MRWRDRYAVGQPVEAVFYMAHGCEWKRAVVVRKTRSGFPVIESPTFPGYTLIVDRKNDIRPVGVAP